MKIDFMTFLHFLFGFYRIVQQYFKSGEWSYFFRRSLLLPYRPRFIAHLVVRYSKKEITEGSVMFFLFLKSD